MNSKFSFFISFSFSKRILLFLILFSKIFLFILLSFFPFKFSLEILLLFLYILFKFSNWFKSSSPSLSPFLSKSSSSLFLEFKLPSKSFEEYASLLFKENKSWFKEILSFSIGSSSFIFWFVGIYGVFSYIF